MWIFLNISNQSFLDDDFSTDNQPSLSLATNQAEPTVVENESNKKSKATSKAAASTKTKKKQAASSEEEPSDADEKCAVSRTWHRNIFFSAKAIIIPFLCIDRMLHQLSSSQIRRMMK